MMPGIGPRHDAGRKRALTAAFTGGGATMAYVVVAASRFSAWEWVPLAVGLGGGLRGHGRDDGDRPAAAAPHRWRMLVLVSRLMPRYAGCRWLAEADSLLSEIAAARRGAAIRSYLLSAPRLVVMT
jgi:hypothetical protein